MARNERGSDAEGGDAPTQELVIKKLVTGKLGGKIANGKCTIVHVNFTIKLDNKIIYYSKVPGKEPFYFKLGINQVIKGLNDGVNDMMVGEVRRLTVPPSYGYGDKLIGDKKVGLIPPQFMAHY